jgi:acyl transferase domain-containing protein/acyl-CoA synthetase (AMP-forming)/AMP-acid ligase II/acyl carrier protein
MQTYVTSRRDSSASEFGEPGTLAEALRATVARGTGGLVYVRADGVELRQSYAELLGEAERIASGLRGQGVRDGDPVLLQLEAGQDFFPGLWGCVLAGAVAVPVAVAPTFSHGNSALQKLLNAGTLLEHAPVLASGAAVEGLRRLPANLGALPGAVLDLGELRRGRVSQPLPRLQATGVAVLLLTSGSTGRPKAVPLTHRNLLAMARGTIEGNGFTAGEVTLNWMALDHIGSVSFLGTMATALGCTQIHVPTGYILQEPLRWLDLIARHRATISWAPNFAFTLFLDRTAAVETGAWDLSSMRFLVNAGEPVVARTARRFITLLQRHGLPVGALRPAFGMSETCSGITWSRGLTLDNTTDDQAFVDLGPAIPGAEMRVVGPAGEELPDGENGMLQLRGPSVFSGYYRNPEENARVFKDGWFETGDLAFLGNGCLHISGRLKDVIIVNGANFYCHEIETAAESVPGLVKTFTAACAVRETAAATDQLALFFCAEPDQRANLETIARLLRTTLFHQVGVTPAYLVALETGEVPKTEIGKIQRAQLKKSFEGGTYGGRVIRPARANGARTVRQRAKSRGELAAAIAEIWQEVLGLERVGHDETFFELGGHSLLIVQVQVRLQELLGRAVPVVELFNCPTVRAMAEHFAQDLAAAESSAAGATAARPERAREPVGDIAIVGMGLRFPGASNPEEFWRVLAEGREMITFFTAEQALAAGVDPDLVRNPNHVRAAPLLDAPESFDAEFFRYSAKEARMIDPQQRVFLEVCWEAFEDAGYDPLTFPGKVGLFAASGMNAYLPNNLWANDKFLQDENGGRMLTVDSMSGFNVMITNDKDYLPMRVSYKLNLRGPSVNVQSACSSTLLTLHEACKSLRMGDCEMALAGGAAIKLPQYAGHLYSPGMLNSPDGHCRAYDEKAEGTIFGNGAGVVLLKPLAAAQAAGDRIYAVVKGTASNNDGNGKVGFTAPSSAGQEEVCAEAMARAGVSPDTVTFMEGHGTGTALGDPIEVNALSSAFRRHTGRSGYCALGSVKTNVGHLQIASGIAGLIKTALALHHRQIPGTLHFEKPNPRINFAATPFYVNRQTIDWASPDGPRRAGVNSLGIGGTNVHAILEEAPAPGPARTEHPTRPWVVPLSARDPSALRQLATRYADRVTRKDSGKLEDIAFTAQVGRAAMPARAAFVADSREDLARQLAAFAAGQGQPAEQIDFDQRGVAFHFSGIVAGGAERARLLWATEPVFRQAVASCLPRREETPEISPALPTDDAKLPADFASGPGALTDVCLLFAFEFALAELLESYGIKPTAVSGDGIGEIVAACRAGVFSVEDALRLVTARQRWLDRTRHADEDAALNRAVAQITFSRPSHRLVSGINGQWVEAELATADYWIRQAMTASQPHLARDTLGADGYRVMVEVGGAASAGDGGPTHLAAGDFASLLASLFTLGYPVQWRQGRHSLPARRVTLPTYPWQHRRYWVDAVNLRGPRNAVTSSVANPLLGRRWRSPRVKACVYETRFDPAAISYLGDHHVQGAIVAPGALYLAQVAQQAEDFLPGLAADNLGVSLSDVVFVSAMIIEPLFPRIVQTVFTPEDGGGHGFEVLSWAEAVPENVIVHATGHCRIERREAVTGDVAQLRSGLHAVADIAGRHYAIMDKMEVRLGPSFRWINELYRGDRQSLLRLEAPVGLEQGRDWHPGLVDSFLQATVAALDLDGARTLIPFRLDRVCFHRNPDGRSLYAHAQQVPDPALLRADVRLYDADGALIAEALGFELRQLHARDVETATAAASTPRFFETILEPLAVPPLPVRAGSIGAWLFLADGDAATRALQRALQAEGATTREVPVARAAEAEALLATQPWAGVVHAWNLPVTRPGALRWRELLACIKAAASRSGAPARWVFLTSTGANGLAQSPLGGFVTGLAQEHPDWRPLHIGMEATETAVEPWVPWLLDTTRSERWLTRRGGVVCGQRLVEKAIAPTDTAIRADGSYLVTGAAGALGQVVAEWLVAQGARSLYLAGRRAASEELQAKIAGWERRGVSARFVVADLGEPQSVRDLVAQASGLQPLRGVFHAAGALRDGLLRQAEAEAFTSIFGSKINGAWELHTATKDQPLDCFVMFSSIASLLGSPGQANYAAGNAFMDALALERQAAGLPGLSIQWGPWEGIGMTARLGLRDRQRLQERGLLAMTPTDALRALERVIGLSGCVGVFAWNRQAYRAAFNGLLPAFYSRILGAAPSAPALEGAARGFAAMRAPERVAAIEHLIREIVATLLGFDSYLKVESEKGLFDLGIDSLTAIDLKDRLEKSLGHTLHSTIAFDYPTAAAMAAHLAGTLFPVAQSPAASDPVASDTNSPAAPAARAVAEADELAALSASDLAALLEKELEG